MEPKNVIKLRDEKAATPEAANARVKALRQLFQWAKECGHATVNPAREAGYLKSRNPDGFKAWTEADVAAFQARHRLGSKARLALDLALYTGARRSDLVRLGPQMERNGALVFAETKGRARITKTHEIPILKPLRRSLEATATGHWCIWSTSMARPIRSRGSVNGSSGAAARPGCIRRCRCTACASSARSAAPDLDQAGRALHPQGQPGEARTRGGGGAARRAQMTNEMAPPFPVIASGGAISPKMRTKSTAILGARIRARNP
jgi:hypothetical protein